MEVFNAFAGGCVNSAYAEAESRKSGVILLNFSDVDLHQQHRHCSDCQLASAGTQIETAPASLWLSNHYVEIFQITLVLPIS